MTARINSFYLDYLGKEVDEYNKTYYLSTDKKSIQADPSALTKETGTNLKALNLRSVVK